MLIIANTEYGLRHVIARCDAVQDEGRCGVDTGKEGDDDRKSTMVRFSRALARLLFVTRPAIAQHQPCN
jgi:hypothetical protein